MTDEEDRLAALLAESDALIRIKRYQAAVERAKDAAQLAPLDFRPYCEWSRAVYGEGHFSEAAELADEAIRLAPESPLGFRLRATALSTLARQSAGADRSRIGHQAVASAREAVRLTPWDPNGHIALAQALPLTGANAEASVVVQEAIRLAPNSASTWVAASLVALGAKQWSAAADASRRALAIDPDNYAALNNLGVALRASGKKREGTDVLARAARVDPDAPTARRNLSRAGMNVTRIAIMVLLIPIAVFAPGGVLLYVAFAVGSNVAISRSPTLALRLERWMAPVALKFAKSTEGPDGQPAVGRRRRSKGSSEADGDLHQPWSLSDGHHAIGTPVVRVVAIVVWAVVAVCLIALTLSGSGAPGLAITIGVAIGVAAWPTSVLIRRRRSER